VSKQVSVYVCGTKIARVRACVTVCMHVYVYEERMGVSERTLARVSKLARI
jgi:hypothetical protein